MKSSTVIILHAISLHVNALIRGEFLSILSYRGILPYVIKINFNLSGLQLEYKISYVKEYC